MKNKDLKKYTLILIFIIIFLVVIDLINITQYIPFSEKYDWLGIGAAIISGILGAIATLIGVNQTINYEKERDRKYELENRKNNYYSYLTFSKQTAKITISLDSTTNINNIYNQIILIGENVESSSPNYFDIELNFDMLNNIFPSAVMLNGLTLFYNDEIRNNETHFEDSECFYKYNKDYNKITIKNKKTVAFVVRCLINREKKDKLSNILEKKKTYRYNCEHKFFKPFKNCNKRKFSSKPRIYNY